MHCCTHMHIPYTHLAHSVIWPLVHRDVSLLRTMEWVLGGTRGCGGCTVQEVGVGNGARLHGCDRAWVGWQEVCCSLHGPFGPLQGHELSKQLIPQWCQHLVVYFGVSGGTSWLNVRIHHAGSSFPPATASKLKEDTENCCFYYIKEHFYWFWWQYFKQASILTRFSALLKSTLWSFYMWTHILFVLWMHKKKL